MLFQQSGHLTNECWRNERLIALHIHNDVTFGPALFTGHFGDAIGSGSMCGGGHDDFRVEGMSGTEDQRIVSSNQHIVGSRLARALIHPLQHRLSTDGHQDLARQSRRCVASGNDDTEHAEPLSVPEEDRRRRAGAPPPPA